MSQFSSYHPLALALYFMSVLLITMFTQNPILLLISLLSGVFFYIKTQKNINYFKEFGVYLLLFMLIALANPLFSHKGVTTLFYLNGNPVTLESIMYGVNIAVMLIAVVYWFKCFNQVMTEDKLMYLFGRISPKTALIISSALRFIPLLKTQAQKIKQAQKAMGLFASESWKDKLKGTLRVYSALITKALENAIDTGSSMKARGYGLKGRSHFSLYKFSSFDALLIIGTVISDTVIIAVMTYGQLDFSFYPYIDHAPVTVYTALAEIIFAILSLLPFIIEVKEDLTWRFYRSRI